jgi:hypothetical protein
MRFNLICLLGFTVFLCGCTQPDLVASFEYKIGDPLREISPLANQDGSQQTQIAIFDKTVRKIHQFDLQSSKHVRTLSVVAPASDHSLLYEQTGNYVIDLTGQHLTIFDNQGGAQRDPVTFLGKPVSTSFRPSTGFLVVYDDLGSVAVLKINNVGKISASWVGGSVVSGNDSSIASGDINDLGQLILGLSDNSIAIVDLNTTLSQQQWVLTRFSTTLDQISWLAPVRGNSDQILVKDKNKISLVSLSQQNILDSVDVSSNKIIKYSRAIDPHIVTRLEAETRIFYVDQSQIHMKSRFNLDYERMLTSYLNLSSDTWKFVDGKVINHFFEPTDSNESRRMTHYRFSDLLAQGGQKIPDNAQVELTEDYIFALYPSELGYAIVYDSNSRPIHKFEAFNVKYITP